MALVIRLKKYYLILKEKTAFCSLILNLKMWLCVLRMMVSFIHIVLLLHLSVTISLTIQTNEQTYQTCIIKDEHTYQPYTKQGEETC